MKNKKIIFLDLDDTLLSSDKTISAGNAGAIDRMLQEGHYVAINTGRPLVSCKELMKELNFNRKGCYMLPFQGSILYDCYEDKVLMRHAMDTNNAMELIQALDDYGIYSQTFTEHGLYTLHDNEVLRTYNARGMENAHIIQSVEELQGHALYKVMGIEFADSKRLHQFQEEYKSRETGRFDSFFSCAYFLEYCQAGSNKGAGLRYLADYLQVPIADTVAVGDERNDIPMILAAGVGVCVCNGREEAKAAADAVTTTDCNHDAIQEVIERYIL